MSINPFQLLSILSSTALFWLAHRTSFPFAVPHSRGRVANGTKILDSKRSVKRRAGRERASLRLRTKRARLVADGEADRLGIDRGRNPMALARSLQASAGINPPSSSCAEWRHDQCFLASGGPRLCRGGMDLLTSEDQLAAVLGHEVEHIDHYHCVERVQIEARLRKLRLDIIGALVQIPLTVWEAGYNKDEELEADREGMRLAVLGGYSPYGAVSLFERFAKLHTEYIIHAQSPEEELSELAIQSLEGYLRSHPQPSERLAQANRLIAQEGWQDRKTEKPFRVEYETRSGKYVK